MRFNSKLVRLKACLGMLQRIACQRFNSKLVRLKAKEKMSMYISKSEFQFQTGSIKSIQFCGGVGDGF